MEPSPMYKFNFPRTILGISMNSIMWSLIPAFVLFWVAGLFMTGIVYIVLCAVVYWYVILKATEWVLEVIPPKFFTHLVEWVVSGSHLYVTNDSLPLPLTVPDQLVRAEGVLKRRTG